VSLLIASTTFISRPADRRESTSSTVAGTASSSVDSRDKAEDLPFTSNSIAPAEEPMEADEDQLLPPPPAAVAEVSDEAPLEEIAAGLRTRIRLETRRLYGDLFQELRLPADLEGKVIDILTEHEKQIVQQALEVARSGSTPVPPSPEALRAQQAQQDQQLHSLLGDSRFSTFNQYRATIPDRILVDDMSREGVNLSENQSRQVLQVLTEARQQIIGQAGITQNLSSMAPDQAIAAMQRQQTLLQQAVANRVQHILTPEQSAALQRVFSRYSVGPKR
jgi:hypothetical protein